MVESMNDVDSVQCPTCGVIHDRPTSADDIYRWECKVLECQLAGSSVQAMYELKLLLNLPFDLSPEAVVASVKVLLAGDKR